MDPLSITFGLVGVAGLFSVCIDVLDRVEVYKTSGTSSSQLLLRVKAEKLKLQQWADAVGIEGKTLKEHHHYILDDGRIQALVNDILLMIANLFGTNDRLSQKLQLLDADRHDARSFPKRTTFKTISNPSSTLSVTAKMKWTFVHEASFTKNVETLEILTEKLYSLVPPFPNQDGTLVPGGDSSDVDQKIQLTLLNLSRELHSLVEDNQIRVRTENLRLIDDLLNFPKLQDELDIHTRNRLAGTCDWIFDNQAYKKWSSSDPDSTAARFLWLYGPPGFGKTILCSNIIGTLRKTRSPFVFHFFSSRHAPDGALNDIIRVWISQIARIDSSSFQLVYKHMEEYILRWELTSSNLWTAFGTIVSQIKQCVFVIDGLDEYKDTGTTLRNFLVSLKQSLAQTSSAILIASRDDSEIRAQLTSNSSLIDESRLFWHSITKTDNRDDISLVSCQIIEDKLANKNTSLRSYLASHLTERCDGMFLWLTMASGEVRKGLSEASLRRKVDSVPKGLNSTYARNWQRILDQSEDEKEQGLKILQWCIFSIRPLTVGELAEALIINPSDEAEEIDPSELPDSIDDDYIESEIKNLCGSLVDAVSPDPAALPDMKNVQLIHLSVKEYLLSMTNQPYSGHSDIHTYFSSTCHLELAKICLDYLCRTKSHTIQESGTVSSNAFREYAIENWTVHRDMAGSDDPSFHRLLAKFLEPNDATFQTWAAITDSRESTVLKVLPEYYNNVEATPLYWASFLGSLPTMELLRNKDKYPVDSIGGIYGTALQAACAKGHHAVITTLLSWGADVNMQAGEFGSALGTSAYYGCETLVLDLLKRGAKIHTQGTRNKTPVYSAARMGHANIVRILLDNGANIGTSNQHGFTPISVASSNGHLEVVQLLLEKGADINKPNNTDITPLSSASFCGHLEVVQLLLAKGADINKANDNNWTPLYCASSEGHCEIVRLLLAKGADINKPDNVNCTPLHCASSEGHYEIVRLLLENGADVNQTDNNGWAPLMKASYEGHNKIVQLLLEKGADVHQADSYGFPPLNYASFSGRLEIISLLLAKGADINRTDSCGCTPLIAASGHGYHEIVQLLLAEGADVNQALDDGYTSLIVASKLGYHEIVQLLLEKDADINQASNDGWTPLNLASQEGHLEVVRLLLEKGANPIIKDNSGGTPLDSAASNGHKGIIELLLLENDVDINVTNEIGYTPLNTASLGGYPEAVRLLLEKGANPNIKNNSGLVPLHSAACMGYKEVVELLLLEKDVDIEVANENGTTPLNLATLNGHLEVVRLLLEKGVNPNVVDHDSHTTIFYAAVEGHFELVRLLLDNGADPSIELNTSDPLLFQVARRGYTEVIKLLSQKLPNQEDGQGRTIIHHVARSGDVTMFNHLLDDQHAVLTLEDNFGRNILDYAAMSGSLDIIERVLTLVQNSSNPMLKQSSVWSPLHWACRNGSLDILRLLMEGGMKSRVVQTSIPEASWSPFDLAAYWDDKDLIPLDDAKHESHPWLSVLANHTNVNDEATISTDMLRSNNLLSPGKKFEGWCDGCFSDIFGPRFRCKECDGFDFCFMCKHEGDVAHPGHEWKCIEPDDEE